MANEIVKSPVTLSPEAVTHFKQQLAKNEKGQGVRFAVKKSGCSGVSYVIDIAESISDTDWVIDYDGLMLYIDKPSLPYINQCEVKIKVQGLNKSVIFENPNAADHCGCGVSFSVKDEKNIKS